MSFNSGLVFSFEVPVVSLALNRDSFKILSLALIFFGGWGECPASLNDGH